MKSLISSRKHLTGCTIKTFEIIKKKMAFVWWATNKCKCWSFSDAESLNESTVESDSSTLTRMSAPDRIELKQMTTENIIQVRVAPSMSKKQRDQVIKKELEIYREQRQTECHRK